MKTHKFPILPLAVALAMAGSATSSSADIAVDVDNAATFNFTTFGGANTYTFTNAELGNFDATVYDKLVFVASSEGMTDVTTVTYGGVALTEAVTAESANRVASIWFLDNPTVNGDLFIDGQNNGNGIGGTLFGLTGTQTGFGNTGTDGSGSSDATNEATLNASLGSIVIGSALGNNNVAGVGSPQITITSGLDSGSSFHSAGYQLVDPAGSVTASFTTSRVVAAAEFKAVTGVTPDLEITSITVTGDTVELQITGDDGTGYYCASSTDLSGFTTEEAVFADSGLTTPIASPFNTSGGSLTFYVDVTGDPRLFFRIQDTDPSP